MTFQVYLWNAWIIKNDSRFKINGDKITIYISTLKDFIELSNQYDLMYSNNILNIDDKGKRFRTR